jgi:hypothetical protein
MSGVMGISVVIIPITSGFETYERRLLTSLTTTSSYGVDNRRLFSMEKSRKPGLIKRICCLLVIVITIK